MSELIKEEVDLTNVDVQQCPYDAYKKLREEAPVYKDPKTGFFIITKYKDVRTVLRDTENFKNSLGAAAQKEDANINSDHVKKGIKLFKERGWVPAPTLAGRDDPNHKEMRSIFDQAFRPSKIKELEPEVKNLSYQLINSFISDGYCNWVKQFSIPLPLKIIGIQMGIENENDLWKIKNSTDAFFHRIGMMLSEEEELETIEREIEGQHYFQPIFEKLRECPNDTLLSDLVNTEIEAWGRTLNDNELHAEMMADTFVGGSETTTNALSAGMRILIERNDIWEKLKSDQDKYLKVFIEEVLRLESPVQSLMRNAAKDVELNGVKIPKGSVINVRYAAANRDSDIFEDPEEVNLDRKKAGAHMAFGSGIHHCLGAPLARRELYWGFKAALDLFDEVKFSEDKNDFAYHPHYLLRSLKELHIEFTPADKL
ncbi:MAG: cytochrome P450 [Alphaproteobacteria bacterium]